MFVEYPVDAVIGYHNNFGCCVMQYPLDAVTGYHNNFGCCVLQYPVDAADNHTNMATRVFECDYLLPGNFGEDIQGVIHRVGSVSMLIC